MKYHTYLQRKLGKQIPEGVKLPGGYHVIGHVILLDVDSCLAEFMSDIAELSLAYEPRAESVLVREGPTSGKYRKPAYRFVAGNPDTETEHVENGVRFRLDPAKVTFSGGNRAERIEMGRTAQQGEKVVDMFACVGQFGLHMAKTGGAEVICIEVNAEAFHYLEGNICLNGLENQVQGVLGDCREEMPEGWADRIVMGYLENTFDYLPHAFRSLHSRGGVIHMHIAAPIRESALIGDHISSTASSFGFVTGYRTRAIKNYAPGIVHLVYDINVVPL
jgi:tRNA wybutosine-synthesizing protein 2